MENSEQSVDENLPPGFIKFLEDNNLDRNIYKKCGNLPRFIRIKRNSGLTKEDLEKEFQGVDHFAGFEKTALNDFLSVNGKVKIRPSKSFQDGKIYGIDISSGFAVRALDPKPGEHVLDLCCAPGAKLAYISDLVGEEGSVTGVDVSRDRLNSCKALARRYDLKNARLFCADGTQFNEPPMYISDNDFHDSILTTKQLRRRNNKRKHEELYGKNKKRKTDNGDADVAKITSPISNYDRVLIDAECTHDGSLKHIEKYSHGNSFGWESFEKNVLDSQRLDNLTQLQRKLLENGFRQTKPGGFFVYSTCSLCRAQNEDVVEWFLEKYGEKARLSPIKVDGINCTRGEGKLKYVIRFDPVVSNTSGLFIAKFHKLHIMN